MKDCIGNDIRIGDFVVYATKTEAPSLEFGYVIDIKEKPQLPWHDGTPRPPETRIKLQHADANGQTKNKTVWEYDRVTEKGHHKDTGKPSQSWLTEHWEASARLMVTQPI
jgi:hypothetical protein